jgi:hypothetical protein
MRYFTPELMERLGSSDRDVARAADQEWDRRLEDYEAHLGRLEPFFSEPFQPFNALLLHDARVLCLALSGDRLLMVLRKDVPPGEVVALTYELVAPPDLDREALPPEQRSNVMDYLYNELDLEENGEGPVFTESILFSNGWELRLRFRNVHVVEGEPFYLGSGNGLAMGQGDAVGAAGPRSG